MTGASVPTQSKFRFMNAAPSQEDEDGVDIYVTLPRQALDFDSTDDSDTKDDAPSSGVPRRSPLRPRATTRC